MNEALKILNTPVTREIKLQTILIKGFDGVLNKIKINQAEEQIEKGIIDSSHSFLFNKSGGEIKEKLIKRQQEEKINKQIHFQNLISLIKQIQIKPEEFCSTYSLRGVNIDFSLLPKKYSWAQMSSDKLEGNSSIDKISLRSSFLTPENQEKENTNYSKLMRDHNQEYEKYIECLIEISYMEALINNLEEENIYPLTSQQLVNLGF